MGYRVDYEPANRAFRGGRQQSLRVPMMTAVFFLLFLFCVVTFWSRGADTLLTVLFPGNVDTTWKALEAFADNLKTGEPASSAFASFCRDIILEAGIA